MPTTQCPGYLWKCPGFYPGHACLAQSYGANPHVTAPAALPVDTLTLIRLPELIVRLIDAFTTVVPPLGTVHVADVTAPFTITVNTSEVPAVPLGPKQKR